MTFAHQAAAAIAAATAATLVSASGASASGAPEQATTPVALDIPAQSYTDSLISLGMKARLSMLDVRACAGRAPALNGSWPAQEALQRLLRDAPCRFQFLDATTVRFSPRPVRAAPRPARPAPAPPVKQLQPLAPSPLHVLDEVVITARKQPEALLRTAGAVTVIGGRRLAQDDAIDVSGVAAQLAAVAITNLGPGRDKLLLRGVSDGAFTGRARSTVATYLDDAPITYNAPDPDLVLTDIDRVEIVRGPQGALYGGGSLGGVFRIVTRAPQLDAFSAGVRARGAWTERGAASGGLELMLNAPLVTDRLAIRAVAYNLDDGGFLQDEALRRSNVDHTIRVGGRLAVLAAFSSDWKLTLSAASQHLSTADTQYMTQNGPILRRANRVREAHSSDFAQASAVIEGRLGDLRLHSATAHVRHDFSNRYDASAALSLFDAPRAEFGAYDEIVHSRIWTQDLYLASPTDRTISWLAGVFASRLDADTPSLLSARLYGDTAPQGLYREARHDRINEVALYGDATVRLGHGWTATAGGRVFRTDVSMNALTQVRASSDRAADGEARRVGASPRLSLQYDGWKSTSLYVLLSEGERAGGFNSGGLRAPTPDRREFRSDRLWNYEGGVKTRLWDGRAEVQGTLFHDVWSNIQTDQFYASGLPYTANVGDGVLSGLEAHGLVRLGERVTLEADGMIARSRISHPNSDFPLIARKGLPGAPGSAATLYAVYEHPLGHDRRLLLTGRAGYTGRARMTFDVTPVTTTSSAYLDATLSAQFVTPRYRLALTVNNPADAKADTFPYGNPFTFGQVRQVTPQRPRTVELVMAATF